MVVALLVKVELLRAAAVLSTVDEINVAVKVVMPISAAAVLVVFVMLVVEPEVLEAVGVLWL